MAVSQMAVGLRFHPKGTPMRASRTKRPWRRALLVPCVATLGWLVTTACHNGGSVVGAEDPQASGGGSVPNGSDPKQAGVMLLPKATIPWQANVGVPGLGLGIGAAMEGKQTVFQPFFEFLNGDSASGFDVQERTEKRAFSSASNVGISANVGFGFFSAAVAYNVNSFSAVSQSNYEFEGFLRLIKERRYLSSATGHYALSPSAQAFLAQAQQARAAQDWSSLDSVRVAFESSHGIGFVSQHVVGYSMSLHAYGNVSASSAAQASSFQTAVRTPWVGGSFTNEQAVATSATSAGMTISGSSRGLNTVINSVTSFYSVVAAFKDFIEGVNPNPSNLVGSPAVLWAGLSEYRDLPEFAAIYDPIPGALFAAVNTPITSQFLQLPTLGAVGELVSFGAYARTPADSVWLSPYLFPGGRSSAPGAFTLDVRPFDLLKQLSRGQQFRQVGDSFLGGVGYHDATAARSIVLPVSTGGVGSEFPEYVGPYYKANVQRIRPVLYVTQPGNPNPVRVAPDNSHWRLVAPMGLGNFGGPGSSTCGLFYGASSLSFQFADPLGELALAAASGRLRLATEVSVGSSSVELSQTKVVESDFICEVWNPSLNWATDPNPPSPGFATARIYPGTKRAVLIRWPAQAEYSVNMSAASASTTWANTAWVGNWQESQDIAWNAPGYWNPGYPGCPFVSVMSNPGGVDMPGAYFAIQGDSVTLNPIGFGSNLLIGVYGNNHLQPGGHASNTGTYLSLLMLGQ